MCDRINCLIDSAADQPYALEIKYHHKCWLKYVRKFQKMSEDDKLPQMQNITYHEVPTMFFDHTQKVIFEEHELRSLQSLLRDYCSIISRFGFPTFGVRSSFIKEILRREFKERIGFYSRPERNHSELVYDVSGGGSYVEAALSSIGISAEQLIYNVAERLREDIKQIKFVPWPPRVEALEEEENLSPHLLMLLSALRGKKSIDLSLCTVTLTSLLMQYVMKQPTTTSINASITLHGVTRSKELIDSFHKLGMGISYSNVLILRDAWTLHDLDRCSVCPDAIAEGQPSISIIDNDEFHSDTLTGGGTSHRCNWMFLQCLEQQLLEYNANVQELHSRTKDVKTMSLALSEKVSEMQAVTPYKTTKRGEPPICPEPAAFSASTEPQRKRSIIHALACVNTNGDRPEVAEQTTMVFTQV